MDTIDVIGLPFLFLAVSLLFWVDYWGLVIEVSKKVSIWLQA